jgi:hypothetical protein
MKIDAITADLLKRTLRAWHTAVTPPPAWLELHLLLQSDADTPAAQLLWLRDLTFDQIKEALNQQRQLYDLPPTPPPGQPMSKDDWTNSLTADFSQNNAHLEAWSMLYHRYVLPFGLSFDELDQVVPITGRHLRRREQMGLNLLVDWLRRAEKEAHDRHQALHLRRYLPAPDYANLFGIDELAQQLAALLQDPDGPHFVSLEGLGGIGKTTLAQIVAYRLADVGQLAGIPWISARQEWVNDQGQLVAFRDAAQSLADVVARLVVQLGQEHLAGLAVADKLEGIKPLLAARPFLIVIDNLETLRDSQALLPALQPLAGRTRFLLTSRHTLAHSPYTHVQPVTPLSPAHSRALIESELQRRGTSITITPAESNRIYDVIGGIPLALKLAVAQMGHLPLDQVLAGLQQADAAPGQMYTYIYRRTWQLLDDPARMLLLDMLTAAPEGEDTDWLQLMSSVPPELFAAALQQLHAYSLLEMSGTATFPRYRLHRLTTTFLQTDVLQQWQT